MFEEILLLFDNFSAAFLFLLVFLVEAGLPIPIPYDILILAAGWREVNFFQILVAVVLGNLAGSTILYYLSLRFGHPILHKGSRFLGVSNKRLKLVEGWFNRWGGVAIVIARLIPGARFAATVLSGIFSLNYFKVFLPYLFAGSVIWVSIYWFLGFLLGEGTQLLAQILGVWSILLTVVVLCLFLIFVVKFYQGIDEKRSGIN